ncbi:MAG: VTT domain-containing protein [Chloroflexia bacterium]|nr:VTT domain-containing protein [Chloroflexia bacterium]
MRRPASMLRANGRYIVSIVASVLLTVLLLWLPLDYQALGGYGYLGVLLMTMLPSATVIFPSPTLAAAWIAGTFLNPWLVGLVAGLGATVGEITGYLAGYGGSALLVRSDHYERVQGLMNRYGLWVVFLLALVPNPLFDLTGIVAGAARVSLWKFLLVALAGKSLRFLLIAHLGAFWEWRSLTLGHFLGSDWARRAFWR